MSCQTKLHSVNWTSPPLFNLTLSRPQLRQLYGEPHSVNLDSNGVGDFDCWLLGFPCGLEVALWWFQNAPRRDAPTTQPRPHGVEVHASQRERGHILAHLGLSQHTPGLGEPDFSFQGPLLWRLCRQDDNGNVFEMARFSSQCEADAMASRYEARGHKQFYWVQDPEGG